MTCQSSEFNIYYGVPHCHTSYSDGAKTPLEAYEEARKNKLDFLMITEHTRYLQDSKYSKHNYDKTILITGASNPKWELLKLEASAVNKRYKDFVALVGYELSTDFWGHLNVIDSSELCGQEIKTASQLYKWLTLNRNVILAVNHPYRLEGVMPYSPDFDKYINLMEVGHGAPPKDYIRSFDYYYRTLDLGWHLAAINGQDIHCGNWGAQDNVTAVLAKELTMNGILEAFKARRVYSTESKTLKLSFTINNCFMGSVLTLKRGDIANFNINIKDYTNTISKVQLITNGGGVLSEKTCDNSNSLDWSFNAHIYSPCWFTIKVFQEAGKEALSSAIFIETHS